VNTAGPPPKQNQRSEAECAVGWAVGDRCFHWLLGLGTVVDTTPWLGGLGVTFDRHPRTEILSEAALERTAN
jgi:hypothetical protein